MPHCHACGAAYDATVRVAFRDVCEGCDADLHACLNCRFYEPGASNDCREEQAERVVDKDRGNRCEWFQPGAGGGPKARGAKKDPRAAAEALFKKKS